LDPRGDFLPDLFGEQFDASVDVEVQSGDSVVQQQVKLREDFTGSFDWKLLGGKQLNGGGRDDFVGS
jgi:hypothetical protein